MKNRIGTKAQVLIKFLSFAKLVKHWPADLMVSDLHLAGDGILSNHKQASIAHSLSLSPSHHLDMTERPCSKDVKSQVIHPFISMTLVTSY